MKFIKKQLDRRSERTYLKKTITKKQINILKQVINSAPTSNNGQSASAIFITDLKVRQKLSEKNWHQKHIVDAPLFIMFLIDLNRMKEAFKKQKQEFKFSSKAFDEMKLIGAIDATIKAQAIQDAVLDMELGACYIGGVRMFANEVKKMLNLPDNVFPVLGMTIGNIKSQEDIKPKMNSVFDNKYSVKQVRDEMKRYDEEMNQYYKSRTNNSKENSTWSEKITKTYKSFK